MALDKAIAHGNEKRKGYRGAIVKKIPDWGFFYNLFNANFITFSTFRFESSFKIAETTF